MFNYKRKEIPADLPIADIAAMIIADLIAIKYDPETDTVFPERIRYAAEVYPRHDTINITVYGLTDAELADPEERPSDDSPHPIDYPAIVDIVANTYGGGSPENPGDGRFLTHVTTLSESEQHRDAARIGQVTEHPHHVPPWLIDKSDH